MAFLRSIFGRDKGKTRPDSQTSAQQLARPDTHALVFIGAMDGKLRALDALTGRQMWEFEAGGWVETTPATSQGLLIATSWNLQTGDTRVFALEARTGTKVWELQPDWGETSSPAISDGDGLAFIGSSSNNLYALDTRTGRQAWEFTTDGGVRGSPTVSEGFVFVGCDDGNAYALSVGSGIKVWQYPTGGRVWHSPAVAGGRVFFGSSDGKVHAVERGIGMKVWEFQTGEGHGANKEIVMSYPAVGQDLVFVSSMDGKVYALEPGTGRMVWKFDAGDLVSPPAVWKDLIIVGSHGFYGLEARTGKQLWKFEADMLTIMAPAVWRDRVFVVGTGSPLSLPPEVLALLGLDLRLVGCRLHALDARTGKQVWEHLHTTEGDMSSPSVWQEGKVEWPMCRGNPQNTGAGVQARDT